jgi:hypothetical protein
MTTRFLSRARIAILAAFLTLPGTFAAAQEEIEFLTKDPGTQVPITIVATLGPAVVHPGEFARVTVEVQIGAPWYIYALRPDPGGGPPTEFKLTNWNGDTPGRLRESRPAEIGDNEFGSSIRVHKERAQFSVDVKFLPDAPPGPVAIEGTLKYAACNGKICLPPRTETFVAKGTVKPGRSRQDIRDIPGGDLNKPPMDR